MTLILASASETRAKMLREAGVPVDVKPSTVDEDVLKAAFREAGKTADKLAEALAEEKAREVASRMPGRLVLGADQVLRFDREIFDKPRDLAEARQHMLRLRGHTHQLISAATIVHDDVVCWRGEASAVLTMRTFSDAFLDEYLDEAGDAVLWSVGGYQIEGRGAQLFESIEGDYFSILGLPMIGVLKGLRREGVITE